MRTFRALTTNVAVAIDDGMPLAEIAHAVIARYPAAETAELHYRLQPGGVHRDENFSAVEQPMDVTPAFEMDLYEQVVTRAAKGLVLHAAAIEVNGQALVLCGASGAGKTTLALTLTARGYRLLTEEVVWIGPDGTVRGLPRALHVPEGSPLRERIPANWTQFTYPIRDRDGAQRHHVLVVPPPDVLQLEPLPLFALVRMGHGPDWPVRLEESPQSDALQRLWDRSLRRDEAGLEVATSLLRRYPSYVLSSTSETEALSLLRTLLK